jgi:hypothetical protein
MRREIHCRCLPEAQNCGCSIYEREEARMPASIGDVSVLLHRMRKLNVDSGARTEELKHLEVGLEDVSDWVSDKWYDAKEAVWTSMGFCNIALLITGTVGGKEYRKDAVLRWKKGVTCALEEALVAVQNRAYWQKVRDDNNVVYYNKNPQKGDNYGTHDRREENLNVLQQKVEANPNLFITLVLEIKG